VGKAAAKSTSSCRGRSKDALDARIALLTLRVLFTGERRSEQAVTEAYAAAARSGSRAYSAQQAGSATRYCNRF
jgi:hypothetical protein